MQRSLRPPRMDFKGPDDRKDQFVVPFWLVFANQYKLSRDKSNMTMQTRSVDGFTVPVLTNSVALEIGEELKYFNPKKKKMELATTMGDTIAMGGAESDNSESEEPKQKRAKRSQPKARGRGRGK